jgi:GTP-binding protein Era
MPDEQEKNSDRGTRCGFVALIGAPNVGKSTLVNALVGSKVTIVSKKVQTTRALIRGIVVEDNAQIILVDTPGIFAPKRRLDRAMVSTAWSGAHDADLVCALIDARAGIDEEADGILSKLEGVNHPKILVLNKIDLVPREKLLALAQKANERLKFTQTFMVSALSGDGVDDLRRALAKDVPPGPFHYPEDQMSDAPMRQLAAEITREKIYRHLHQELPYQSTVETDSGRTARMVQCGSSRRSLWSATASARSCSARVARPSSRSARIRARKSRRLSVSRCICFCS